MLRPEVLLRALTMYNYEIPDLSFVATAYIAESQDMTNLKGQRKTFVTRGFT